MLQKRLALQSLSLIICLLALHLLATKFYWYVSIEWFDMFMHALGGLFLAVFAAALFTRHIQKLPYFETLVLLLLFVLIIGLGWEFFEYGVQYFIKGSAKLADVPDSISDIVCDLLGGLLGVYFVQKLKKRYNEGNE